VKKYTKRKDWITRQSTRTQTGSRKPPEKINFWQGKRGLPLQPPGHSTRYWNHYRTRISARCRRLGRGSPAGRATAGRGYLCVSRKKNSSVSQRGLVWITRLSASFRLTDNKSKQRILKVNSLNYQIDFSPTQGTLRVKSPQWSRQFCCWVFLPYGLVS
jgi:hypothetical protein